MIIALSGWVDAGEAGSGSSTLLRGQLESEREFAHYDLRDLLDLQQTRPTIELVDGMTRQINWPMINLTAGQAGRDVVLCIGPEPSLRWPTFVGELVDMAKRLGVERAFTLGGMPALVSHRQPMTVMSTATSPELAAAIGAAPTDYRGPTGAQTALQLALGDAGVPSIALWAQVPHYVAGNPSPPGMKALLERLRDLGGLQVDTTPLDEECDAYTAKVEDGLAERPDIAELVQAIESNATPGEVSGDELAAEIERFLRDQ